ncbi:u3 small nucleolar rna-associated protein 6 [Stylonychia lemnae]|uniref:U3 small nucleolar rna-associated protein 6 n=1 Tax=Stylonychia lemnae TaxID=5949 RepID=A0A078ASI8_STYLE|nr:u3 small nucleolar rna-associated protein 6 [Stylonychia lemnae]|eukprot:CDW85134.1 u3 small nucleolar rna-associated protein 6 [Stylonychia lemnae]
MADKVEVVLEKMTDELQYYISQELFSKREVKKIVKERRASEYKMQRKDASLLFFMDSIDFEKKLDKLRMKRKNKRVGKDGSGAQKVVLMDHSIKRRIMYLYDRGIRKFKNNIALHKEYMEYLVSNKSFQKLNRVLAKSVQIHPNVLDFWLIGVYAEHDMRGNLFSSRKLMLQAIRNNPDNANFYVEYFKYEIKFFEKIKQRIQILNSGGEQEEKKIDFIMDEEDEVQSQHSNKNEEIENIDLEDGKLSGSANLVEIVFDNILEQFGDRVDIIKRCRDISRQSELLEESLKNKINSSYQQMKNTNEGFLKYSQMKLKDQSISIEKLSKLLEKNSDKFEEDEIQQQVLIKLESIIEKKEQIEEKRQIIKLIMDNMNLNVNQCQDLLLKYHRIIDLTNKQYTMMIDGILKSQNRNLPSIYLHIKSMRTVPKDLLAELEQKSWNYKEFKDLQLIVNSKSIILNEMLKMKKQSLAEEYLKKCLLQFSGVAQLKSDIIYQYSKLLKSAELQEVNQSISFLIEQISKSSCIIKDKVYDNLLLTINLSLPSKKQNCQEVINRIYESKIHNGDNKKDSSKWLEYISYLVNIENNEGKARDVFENGLQNVSKGSQEGYIQSYNKIISSKQ